jgi:sugar phosphate isomerase/epimerase
MNRLGIFAKTFSGSLPEILSRIEGLGLMHMQFSMACGGLPAMPDAVDDATRETIEAALRAHPIRVEALSGTFNMCHPDPQARALGLKRLEVLMACCQWLDTSLVTLCSGTRHPADMWAPHPDNGTAQAWHDMRQTLDKALEMAEMYDVVLGIEPESANVVSDVARAERLLREVRFYRLKIVFDPANLFEREPLPVIHRRIEEGLDRLGEFIVSAHAKDRNERGEVVAAGKGLVPFDRYLTGLKNTGYRGNLMLHGLPADEVANALDFLKLSLQRAEWD